MVDFSKGPRGRSLRKDERALSAFSLAAVVEEVEPHKPLTIGAAEPHQPRTTRGRKMLAFWG